MIMKTSFEVMDDFMDRLQSLLTEYNAKLYIDGMQYNLIRVDIPAVLIGEELISADANFSLEDRAL